MIEIPHILINRKILFDLFSLKYRELEIVYIVYKRRNKIYMNILTINELKANPVY